MKKSITAIILLGLFIIIRQFAPMSDHALHAQSTVLTGIVLLSAYLLALLLKNIKLPKLTGYMILGILVGPVGLNFLNHSVLDSLKFLEDLALAFIALTAGGELKYERFRERAKTVLYLLTGQMVVVFAGLFLTLIFLAPHIPFLSGLQDEIVIGFSILFAGTALSKSPATTIGIITELKSKGKMTDIVLSVTVLKSIMVVLLFPLIMAWAKFYLIAGTNINSELVKSLGIQIIGSIVMGIIIGYVIIAYLKYIQIERSLFLLGVSIVIIEVSALVHVEILLTSIVAGIVVENFSKKGEELIENIEKSSLPLYIIFFSFAGAGLHLDTIQKALGLTALLVILRLIFLYMGNAAGALLAKEDRDVKRLSWLGFVGQAGIAVGLGTIIENTFPGGVGTTFKTILISSVVVNELMGPIFFKYILIKTKEMAEGI